MVKLISSRAKRQRKSSTSLPVSRTHPGEQIYETNCFHRQTFLHILPWQCKGHRAPDMFSCQPLVDFFKKKKKKVSLSMGESGFGGTWQNGIWHRVQLSHISDRRCSGLLIWALSPLELRYHNTHWQPQERLFPHAARSHTQTKNGWSDFKQKKAWNYYLLWLNPAGPKSPLFLF